MNDTKTSRRVGFKRTARSERKLIDADNPVTVKPLFAVEDGILLFQSLDNGLDLIKWTKDNKTYIEDNLNRSGAILFRGFNLNKDEDFVRYVDAAPYDKLNYLERSSPRKTVSDKVYTSTVYPADQSIALHNENTASICFALKVWFYCQTPSLTGGETPIADARKVLKRIDPDVLDKFRSLGWMLVRNYGQNLGYGWQDAFDGKNKSQVEEYCRSNRIEMQWRDNNSLWTRQIRSATLAHPITNEEVWFNHISFWHTANLESSVLNFMLNEVGELGLPYSTYYGDGSKIPDDIARHLKEAYLQEKLKFPWQKGDLLLLDNMLQCHGREPFTGDRKIRVALAQPYTRPDFQ